jgi:hypothetical protein
VRLVQLGLQAHKVLEVQMGQQGHKGLPEQQVLQDLRVQQGPLVPAVKMVKMVQVPIKWR